MSLFHFWKGMSQEPSSKKHKLDDEEKKARDREYEKVKRKRDFLHPWKKEFPWVVYDPQTEKMHCGVCKARQPGEKGDGFAGEGSSNFRKDGLTRHQNSDYHKRSCEIDSAKKAKPGTSQAAHIMNKLNQHQIHRLSHQFRSCHALAKHGGSFRDYIWLNELDKKKGLDIGTSYMNDRSAQVFTHFIAQHQRNEILETIKEAPFISVIIDGSTDSGSLEGELTYTRLCNRGEIKCIFSGYVNVERANAPGILKAIDTSMERLGAADIWKDKLVGFGSDGASVMMGRKGGVAALLKCEKPDLQAVHCASHRLELAYRDTFRKENLYAKVEAVMTGLYLFYSKSPLNRANLQTTFEALKQKPVVPTRFAGTRWIPHTEVAVNNVIRGYEAITTHLSQIQENRSSSADARGKAKNYLKVLKSCDTVLLLHFLADITSCLGMLSKAFQRPEATVAEIHDLTDATMQLLSKYTIREGPRLSEVKETDTFGGLHLTGSRTDFNALRTRVIDSLISRLKSRFEDVSEGVLKSCKLASLRNWPNHGSEAYDDFGEEEVAVAICAFKDTLLAADVNTYSILPEFQQLKSLLSKRKDILSLKWATVWALYGDMCPNFLRLIDLFVTLPAHSADCERGFSHLKHVKTCHRSKLRDDRVTDALTIILETPDVKEFDPLPAISLWNESSTRRLGCTQQVREDVEDSDGEDFIDEFLQTALKRLHAIDDESD